MFDATATLEPGGQSLNMKAISMASEWAKCSCAKSDFSNLPHLQPKCQTNHHHIIKDFAKPGWLVSQKQEIKISLLKMY